MMSSSHPSRIVTRAAAAPQDIAACALAGMLRDIVASGLKPVEALDIADAIAVHDLRKALKGWRAMMRLIAPTVGEEAEAMRVEARDLARHIAAARDSQAAQEAFTDLLDDPGCDLPEVARAAVSQRLAALRASAEAVSLTPASRARVREMWKRAAAAIERWPLARFDHTEAARQLGASYRRVCKAIPQDWSKASPEALHKLRQRVVEHRYQMELADPLWPKVMRVWVSEAQRLRDRLGAHHDLAILQHLTAPHQPLSRWHSRLTPLIAARQAAHAAAARRLTGRLFAETPKAFFRRMASLWEHRAKEED
jgi:CHAD domain-containing protein